MQFDELYKFLGYGLVCLLLFYIAAKSLRFQLGIIEGLVGIKKDKKTTDRAQQDQVQQDQSEDDDQSQKDQAEEDQAEEDQADMDQAELDHE
jgi:hypothetical protein